MSVVEKMALLEDVQSQGEAWFQEPGGKRGQGFQGEPAVLHSFLWVL
jgi:hypothetical protein